MRNRYILLAVLLLASSCGQRQHKHASPMANADVAEVIAEQVAVDSVASALDSAQVPEAEGPTPAEAAPTFDKADYDARLDTLAHGDTLRWPVKGLPYPKEGAILPFKRIVAYYGNLYSARMGVLGEYPPQTLWKMLRKEVAAWEAADSLTPVQPAIQYIASTAQGSPGKAGMYRMRMPNSQIDSAYAIAKMGDAILILDIQTGHSSVQNEVPVVEEYLKRPDVHLAVDPEFSMKDGTVPGKKIGTMDASDINWCIDYLTKLVQENNLPPKVLVVHRFTMKMLTGFEAIKPTPEVQVVINMDGWGAPSLKRSTYRMCITPQPVQFTGFKLFYKNDLKGGGRLMTPSEILDLTPRPIYIQYQ